MSSTLVEHLNTAEAADYLRHPAATLAYWRTTGIGPAYVKLGRRVLYRRSDLDDWVTSQVVHPGAA